MIRGRIYGQLVLLFADRARAALTICVLAAAVYLVGAALLYGQAVIRSADARVRAYSGSPSAFLVMGKWVPPGSKHRPITFDEVQDLSVRLAGMARCANATFGDGATVAIAGQSSRAENTYITALEAVGQDERFDTQWGRLLMSRDEGNSPIPCIFNAALAQKLGARSDAIGKTVLVNGVAMQLVGVLKPMSKGRFGVEAESPGVTVPYSAGRSRLKLGDNVQITVYVQEESNYEAVERRVADFFRERHGILSGEPDDFQLVSPTEVLKAQRSIYRAYRFATIAAASIGLFLACLLILIFSQNHARQSARTIALKRSMGATRNRVAAELTLEFSLLGFVGGLLSIGLLYSTVAFLKNVNYEGYDPRLFLTLKPSTAVALLILSAGFATISSLFPALGSSRRPISLANLK